jgi:hypothetical protein
VTASPFPGMDPYLEDPRLWPEFHGRLVALMHKLIALTQKVVLGSAYDVVLKQRRLPSGKEDYIEIRMKRDETLVTLIDVVSPANKTTKQGRLAFLETRKVARQQKASVVEIDLLLQGPPMLDYDRHGMPVWDYAVTLTRGTSAERHEIYGSTLKKSLPRFKIPLAASDRDTALDLQTVFARSFIEGRYVERIDYSRDPVAPLSEENLAWVNNMLIAQNLRRRAPTRDEVAVAAYYLWEQDGRPHGLDSDHWLRAIEQLRQRKV